MAKNPENLLTKKRRTWAQNRDGAIFKGTPLTVNASTQDKLQRQLAAMAERMASASQKALAAHFRDKGGVPVRLLRGLEIRYQDWFDSRAKVLAYRAISSTEKHSASILWESLKQATGGKSLPVNKGSSLVDQAVKASIEQNVQLIKSIPSQYFERINGLVMREAQAGFPDKDRLADELAHIGGITENRAKFIARDQVAKANMAISTAKMKAVGVTKFEWLHSGGPNERELHLEYDGQIFELDNPPIIDRSTGVRGYPGMLPNCRCRMLPIIEYTGPDDGDK